MVGELGCSADLRKVKGLIGVSESKPHFQSLPTGSALVSPQGAVYGSVQSQSKHLGPRIPQPRPKRVVEI